jgi:spore coat-associated protein N
MTEAASAKAPSRWNMLMRKPRRLIIALVLIVVAIAAAFFTTATFTSSSANAGNVVATGDLQINNSEDGAILNATGLVPGDSVQGTVTITNVGSADGSFSVEPQNLVDNPADPPLSKQLDFSFREQGKEAALFDGKLGNCGTIQLGRWEPGESHTYVLKATFPNGMPANDNRFQNASTTVDFVWNAVS